MSIYADTYDAARSFPSTKALEAAMYGMTTAVHEANPTEDHCEGFCQPCAELYIQVGWGMKAALGAAREVDFGQ